MTGRRSLVQRVERLERLAVLREDNDPTLGDYGEPYPHDTLPGQDRDAGDS